MQVKRSLNRHSNVNNAITPEEKMGEKRQTPLSYVTHLESPVCYSDLEAVINSTSGTELDRPQSLITH